MQFSFTPDDKFLFALPTIPTPLISINFTMTKRDKLPPTPGVPFTTHKASDSQSNYCWSYNQSIKTHEMSKTCEVYNLTGESDVMVAMTTDWQQMGEQVVA